MDADRFSTAFEIDLKAVKEDGEFEGYASVYGNKDLGGDIVMAGAFEKSLAKSGRVKMLWQHDPSKPIGVWDKWSDHSQGLKGKGRFLLTTTAGREAYEMVKAGAVDGLSIGYRTVRDEYDTGKRARLIKEADLVEVSVVTFPMNPKATITAVKAADIDPREFEHRLREAGVSRSNAVICVGVLRKMARCDVGSDDQGSRDANAAIAQELNRIAALFG
jgi:uncharacterized protein